MQSLLSPGSFQSLLMHYGLVPSPELFLRANPVEWLLLLLLLMPRRHVIGSWCETHTLQPQGFLELPVRLLMHPPRWSRSFIAQPGW